MGIELGIAAAGTAAKRARAWLKDSAGHALLTRHIQRIRAVILSLHNRTATKPTSSMAERCFPKTASTSLRPR